MFANNNNFELNIVNFDEITFNEQVESMRESGIIIALHGAGLVNTQFAPSAGALIEISPHNFHRAVHYIQGGYTNLWYSQYIVETVGVNGEYEGLYSEFNGDAYTCCYEDKKCKRFYRDQLVTLGKSDLNKIQYKLELATSFINKQYDQGEKIKIIQM